MTTTGYTFAASNGRTEPLAERALTLAAMAGAVGGAIAGAALGTAAGAMPELVGTLGVVLGSGFAAGAWSLLAGLGHSQHPHPSADDRHQLTGRTGGDRAASLESSAFRIEAGTSH